MYTRNVVLYEAREHVSVITDVLANLDFCADNQEMVARSSQQDCGRSEHEKLGRTLLDLLTTKPLKERVH